MNDFTQLLQQGNAWLFVPSAVLLGALHGLEPGHSKTMMAAFIVAIRGTVAQSVLLGLSATVSHTAIVWMVAMAGLYLGRNWNAEAVEPYFQVASAIAILLVAIWMVVRTWRSQHAEAHHHPHDEADAWGLHAHGSQDAHALSHANDFRKRFASKEVTTGQIVLFGLTGGLVPCPASITILLLCLQVKRVALGATLVLCFSIGLALVMVATGALAALSVRHVSRGWRGFDAWAHKAPYLSGALIMLVGIYMGYQGLHTLSMR